MMTRIRALATALCCASFSITGSAVNLELKNPELAGISGFRSYWDKPVVLAENGALRDSNHGAHGAGPVADWSTEQPGAIAFDAVHRRLLLRFPDAADQLAEQLRAGNHIAKAEIIFEFIDYEYFPMDYVLPSGMSFLGNLWVRKQPRWHAVAYALREPWTADPEAGPTFNASVNGKRFWTHFGARDPESDRYPLEFGPTELSAEQTESRMDITPLLTDPQFGKTMAARLRAFSDQGLIVRKWERYDALFNHGGYEYGAPGHRGIRVKTPRLVVTLAAGALPEQAVTNLPPATNVRALPATGKATAVTPSPETIEQYIAQYRARQADNMPDWQWQRIQQLLSLSPRQTGFPENVDGYLKWIDHFNAMPYRLFTGHHTTLTTHDCLLYSDAWPAPVKEHMKRYWDGWLMPGRPYTELQHNQWGIWTKEENNYYAQTGDWRGNHSFYRDSYTRFMSTMNFNHNAIMAALLGAFTDNAEAIADGRFGLETILLRLWSWYDGTTQESIDHYYLGLTLYGQKSFADLGPTPLDRLMGTSMLLKTMDELASCYHPALKRFIATGGRTGVAELLAINEGPNHIMHTVSQKGALHDLDNPNRLGMPAIGHDCPPNLVGHQALIGPWMPLWMGNIVDNKPFPFEMTASYKMWGAHRQLPLWKRSFLSQYYGLATLDVLGGNETVPIMAQWRRQPGDKADIQDIGTLLMRFGINNTEFYDSLYHGTTTSNANGSVGTQGGFTAAVQSRNKAILLTSPYENLEIHGRAKPDAIHSFQSSIALANYQENPTWKIYVDGHVVSTFPAKATMASRIVIEDGVTFIGLTPIPATDFGRSEEILITTGGEPVALQGGGKAAPTLVINSYHYLNPETPFPSGETLTNNAEMTAKLARAYSGFVLEMGDTSQYPTFADFQKHLISTQLSLEWNEEQDMLDLVYLSGKDRFEVGFRPQYAGARWGKNVPTNECFTYRRVNGEWPYLPPGIERDSTLGQQGTTGLLEKNGASLHVQPGRMGYLLTDPISNSVLFANPLPDPQFFRANTAEGIRIASDGRVGLLHLLVSPAEPRIDIRYGPKSEQTGPEMADALWISELEQKPAVWFNDTPVETVRQITLDNNKKAWVIPLTAKGTAMSNEQLATKFKDCAAPRDEALSTLTATQTVMHYLPGQEHYVLTEPQVGAYSFWRQWPGESPIEAIVPGNVRIATDGAIAMQRLIVSPEKRHILLDYAPYLQQDKEGNPIANRAQALIVFGMPEAPTVVLHGKTYEGKAIQATIDGEQAWIIPLFGGDSSAIGNGIKARYQEAMKAIR